MAAPYGKIFEKDESGYINSELGVNTYIASWAPCGPVGTKTVLNSKNFYKTYTPDNAYKSGYPVAFLNAEALFDLEATVNFCRVVPEDALYGGAVVTIGNSKPSYSLQNGLASPESFVFAETVDNKTNEQISILCKEDVSGSLGGTYFYLPGQKSFIFIKTSARAEKATVTCNADVTSSLNNVYFILPGQNYYVWLNVGSTGTDPGDTALTLSGMTGVEVAIEANADASAVASAINTALSANADVTSEVSEAVLTLTRKTTGVTPHGNAGNSGFSYMTTEIGLDESKDVALSDMTAYPANIKPDATAAEVATAINSAVSSIAEFTGKVDEENDALVIITATKPGYISDAIDGANPTNFVFTTVTQGSSQSGSEALMFYSSDPNALDLSIKIYSNQDHPEKAPLANTFLVETYRDGVLETSITCSRKQDMKDGMGQPLYVEQAMLASSYIRCRNNEAVSDDEIPASITTALKLTGGSPGTNVTTGDMINAVQEWRNRDDFDITLMLVGGWTDPAYTYELENIASTRGDCAVINSIPYYVENTADYLDNTIKYRKNDLNINSSYIATFTSNLEVFNADLNKNMYIPSDGHIAGAIVNASRNYQIYYPILGFKRGILSNVVGVKHKYTREEMDALYDVQLNPIRFVSGRGIVIWGQKTMQSQPSSLDRLNARLLLCSMKPQLQQFLEDNIGELNSETTRDKMILLISGLLDSYATNDGISSDYEVSCDPVDPNNPNKLSVQLKIQIVPAVEFAELTITLLPTGVTFS